MIKRFLEGQSSRFPEARGSVDLDFLIWTPTNAPIERMKKKAAMKIYSVGMSVPRMSDVEMSVLTPVTIFLSLFRCAFFRSKTLE